MTAKLVDGAGAANTAAENDGFAWNRTLQTAAQQNADLNFVISAGDQVNKTGKPKEEEYASCDLDQRFSPVLQLQLRSETMIL